MQGIKIPHYADDPPQMFIFSLEEFVILVLFMVVGILFNFLFPSMLIGVGFGRLFKKMQEGGMPGLLFHMMWWIGIVTFKGRFSIGLIREVYS